MICSANLLRHVRPRHGAYVSRCRRTVPDALKEQKHSPKPSTAPHRAPCAPDRAPQAPTSVYAHRRPSQDDGSYAITGTKIFISAGEHDLTENILHLVLAKIPAALRGRASRCSWC